MSDGMPKREFTRVSVDFRVELAADGMTILCEKTRDISMKGIYVVTGRRLPLGTECGISIRLGEGGSGPKLQVSGTIVRVDALGMALEFGEMGIDTYDHLRNLVLYNSADPGTVERELNEHLGLKKRAK